MNLVIYINPHYCTNPHTVPWSRMLKLLTSSPSKMRNNKRLQLILRLVEQRQHRCVIWPHTLSIHALEISYQCTPYTHLINAHLSHTRPINAHMFTHIFSLSLAIHALSNHYLFTSRQYTPDQHAPINTRPSHTHPVSPLTLQSFLLRKEKFLTVQNPGTVASLKSKNKDATVPGFCTVKNFSLRSRKL